MPGDKLAHLALDDFPGRLDGRAALAPRRRDRLLQIIQVVQINVFDLRDIAATSRGTAMSIKNTGRYRRCCITASNSERVIIGSLDPVPVMTMSAAAR